MTNYDNIIAGTLASNQQAEPVKYGLSVASETDADAYAEAKRVAARTGVPVDTALNMPKEMKRQADIGSINFDTLVNTSPTTAALLSDIDRAKLAHDNVHSLSGIETLMRSFKRGLTSGLRGNDASNVEEASRILSIIDQLEAGGQLDINSPYASLFAGTGSSPENLKSLRQFQQSRLAENAVEFSQRTQQLEGLYPTGPLAQFYSAEGWKDALSRFIKNPLSIAGNIVSESTGLLAPSLPLIVGSGVAGGARGLAAASGATSASAEYGTAIAEAIQASGVDINDQQAVNAFTQSPEFSEVRRQAMVKAGVVGAFDAITARAAGIRLAPSTAGNLAAQTGVQAGGGAAGEAFGSVASGQEINPSAVIAEAIGELPGAVVDVASLAGRQIISNTEKAEIAQQGAELIDNLNKLASADKLLARDPATFEQFIAEAAEDGPVQQVFIDAQTLMQSGLANQLASISLAVASQLEPAIESGGQIAIPVEEYAAYIAPTDLAAGLLDHLKTEPDGFTRAEAQSFMENRASELESEVERVLSEKAVDDTFKQSTEAVKLNLKGQLDTAARFTPQVNDAYSSMVGHFYGVMAAKLKITPEKLYEKFPLRIGAEGMDGLQFDQGVWHGTPHLGIDESGFKLNAIGSGEGNQAYGWGIYFAGDRSVAEGYRKNLSYREQVRNFRADLPDDASFEDVMESMARGELPQSTADVVAALDADDWLGFDYPAQAITAAFRELENFDPSQALRDAIQRWSGQVYQAEIPENSELLNWDLPFSQQSESVRSALNKVAGGTSFMESLQPFEDTTGEGLYLALTRDLGSPELASRALAAAGIPGLRYLDGNSRAQGDGTYNYVVWDESLLTPETANIKALYQSAPPQSAGVRRAQVEGSSEFKKWFGDSKVVDDDGRPLVVYRYAKSEGEIAGGVRFFTREADYAEAYFEESGQGRGLTAPVYLSLKNPLEVDLPAGEFSNPGAENPHIEKALQDGNDGVIFRNGIDEFYVAFAPEQIKSATGNRGTFDSNDANILYQSGPAPFSIAPIQKAWSDAGIDGSISERDGVITVSKIVVPEDVRNQGRGTAALQSLIEYADFTSQHIALTPSADFGGNKKRLIDFYKRFGFVENKGKNRAFSTSESMYREAPGRVLYQSERTQQAVHKWQEAMLKVRASNPNYIPKLDTPAVLKALGIKQTKLEVPTRYLLEILNRHKDVPEDVFYNLPALLADPIAAVPYKDGGYRVFVDATTAKGEPVAVGVGEDGRIHTITPLHDYQDKTGAERMQEAFDRALGQAGAKVYARNKETLAKAKVSDGAPSGTIPLRRDSHNKAIVVTREQLVKQMGNEFYQEARGAFSPDTNTITLLKNADLSTFLHESGHFFLEIQTKITSQLQQESAMFGLESLSPEERELISDTDALLKWFGIKSLDEWYSLDFEEMRHYHEQFARGFEAYLFEGNSPNIEMHGLFQRFRAWMLSVYRDLKALNVELNAEVRGVFDRMLATNEQITLAEQGRSMLPLFNTPEQSGMTVEEFAAYQSLGVEATADAIDNLQKRGLRDMRWIHNARGRVIKQLQDKAKGERTAIKIDVRREVMSQPIYRAWQFLTAKVEGDDRIAEPAKRTSSLNMVDESIDSLFMAVAKLGGIPRAEAQSQWGLDPKERIPMPAFGKHVLRNEGGLSLDSMAESLAQYGYLAVDENGKHNLNDFEDKFFEELRGNAQYSVAYDYEAQNSDRSGVVNPDALGAGRFDNVDLAEMDLPTEILNLLQARKMTAKTGLHPDMVAEMFGFSSGDELVRTLAAVSDPASTIESLTDIRMLEEFGELSSQDAIEKAADAAIHNDARARFITTEANALSKATGQTKILSGAARQFARNMIARLKVRDIRPGQYANAEVRAAKASERASRAGDVATAAAEKRNQLIQNHATRAAYDALDDVEKNLRYLKRFEGAIKNLDADYADQITGLLERFDLRVSQSNRSVDRRTGLANWIKSQREAGFEPDIPPELENEAFRTSYKNLTVEEFRGLADSVRQIEHLGRLKHKLLTSANNRAYEAARDEITASIRGNGMDRQADTRTATTNAGRAAQGLKRFFAAHIKAATWARIMDGNQDGGPVWEYFIRSANERGDMETTMRAEATTALSEILDPVFKMGKMGGKGQFFPTINRSLNRESRIAIALNMGNEGNMQRLLGGEGWSIDQVAPVLRSLSEAEWRAVQAIWDHFETYRPLIAEKERRIYGKEPQWIEPRPFNVTTSDGATISIKGGYYPIKYDPAASQRAEEHSDAESAKRQLQGAYTTATTRRSFTKTRTEEVQGRPLLYTVAGVYSGVNDVIHDLAWHEWLIDANRLLKSQSIDAAMRQHYGPEVKQQFKSWVQDVAEGDKGAANAGEMALGRLRQGVSASGLGFNIMSALIQPLGLTQSIVRVGASWICRGLMKYIANPIRATREANGLSTFMENRARTRFRELNELRNKVQDQTAFNEVVGRYAYFLMMRCQQMVDVPTWWGAYEKAIAEGNDDARSVSLADQAVIDAQGGGQTKDLSAIERGGPTLRLFTVFYSFMNTALNLGVAQTMGANTQAKKAKLAADYLMLYTVPAVLGYFWKEAFTPGGDDDEDWSDLAKKLAAEQLSYLMGLMFVVREFSEASKIITGAEGARDYSGPAGIRGIADSLKLLKQVEQGEFDTAFRKSLVSLVGDFTGLPAAQINRTITGTEALVDGETENPAAILMGYQQ